MNVARPLLPSAAAAAAVACAGVALAGVACGDTAGDVFVRGGQVAAAGAGGALFVNGAPLPVGPPPPAPGAWRSALGARRANV